MADENCAPYDLICLGEKGISHAVGGAIDDLANAVLEAVGTMTTSLGTMWVYIGTPNLTTTGGRESVVQAGASDPGAGELTTLLGYVMGIGLTLAVISMIWLAGLMAASMRRGEGLLNVGRLGAVLGGVVVIGSASAIVAGVLPDGPRNTAGATLFIQSALWYYTGAVALAAVVVGGARMAWNARADEGRSLLQGLVTLIVVAAFGVTGTQALISVADSFSVWILRGSLQCDVSADANCFGENVLILLPLATRTAAAPGGPVLGSIVVIVLGIIAFLVAALQVVLMVARAGMLVILAGILPISAAATNTETGKAWFRRCIGWLVAAILYKPAAAIVYAAAFQLVGTNVFGSGDALIAVLTGLMLMLLALIALPALMRFVTPLVGAVTGGAGGAAVAGGAMAALPMGAVQAGRLMGGRSSSDSSGDSSTSSSGPSGASTSSGPSGADGATGPQGSGGTPGGTPPVGVAGSSTAGATGSAGASGAGASGAGAASGASGAAAGAGAGTGAGAAAGGATTAGAAAGPVGAAAGAAVDLAARAGQAASAAAQAVAKDSTGDNEGGGPSGSR